MIKYLIILSLTIFQLHFVKINAQTEINKKKPVLVIQVIVEQMRADLIDRYWDNFSDKGFKRLINEGAYCSNAYYDYMVTESAPGYATIVTGNNPSGHGIISDSWYLKLSGREQNCVFDPSLPDKLGFPKKNKFSSKFLIGSTIGDELRISNFKQSKVISISDKPYSAVLTSGHIGNAAYWIDEETANWTSSPYFMDSIPKWATEFNQKQFAKYYLTREWNTINPKSTYKESLADNNSYETGFSNKQKTFPYKLSELSNKEGLKILKYTPFGNTYTIDFSIAAIINENLGKDEYPDLLTISFGTTGNVCDLFGLRSIELEDIYIRLDKDIAHLLGFIDDNFGKDNVLVVITSDRGASDNPLLMSDIGMPVGNFYPNQSIPLLESYLKALYGTTGWVKHYSDKQIYLDDITVDASKTPAGEVQMKAALFISQFQAVASATTGHVLQTTNFTSGDLQKFQNSYNMVRSGDILITLKPGWVESVPFKNADGKETDQVTPYRYDAHVPLIFYGYKIKNTKIEKPVSISDIAPTISRILGISFPNSAKGQVIELLQNQ